MATRVYDLDMMLDPKAHGMEMCSHCAGYGSSLKESQDRCSQCDGLGLIKSPTKFKVEVQADNTGTWAGNALTFDTTEEAELYAQDLAARWTAVRDWRVVPA